MSAVDVPLSAHALAASFVTPIVLALVVMLRPAAARPAVALGALPALMLAFMIAFFGASVPSLDVDWLMLGARFGADASTPPLIMLTALVWTAGGVALTGYASRDGLVRLAPWWLLALGGNVALVVALDELTFFLAFAIMSFASYALVVDRRDPLALTAARRYMVFVVIGEVALFNALVLDVADHDALRTVLLIVGFGIKASLLGLHAWLPLAHTAAPAPASAVLSGAMIAAGTLGMLRFADPGALAVAGPAVAGLGIAAALYAAVMGVLQKHPKAVLAYSSVAQMGLVSLAVGCWLGGQPTAAIVAALYALHHGVAKAALFLAVALCERVSGMRRWIAIALTLLPALAIIGVPFTTGATVKTGLKASTVAMSDLQSLPLATMLTLAAVGSTLLIARYLWLMPIANERRPLPASIVVGWLIAVVGSVAIVPRFLPTTHSAELASLVPIVAGAAIALVVWLLAYAHVLPRLAPRDEHTATSLVQLMRVDVMPVVRFEASPALIRGQGVARVAEALRSIEARFRDFAWPGLATACIALAIAMFIGVAVGSEGLS